MRDAIRILGLANTGMLLVYALLGYQAAYEIG